MRCSLALTLLLAAGLFNEATGEGVETVTVPPPQSGLITITSPVAHADLSGETPVRITWQSAVAGEATYSIGYSPDGDKVTEPIARKLSATEYIWTPNPSNYLCGCIKIKALDKSEIVLAEQSVPVSFLPRTAIVVSKANQKVFYFSDGALKSVFTCSTAQPKYDLQPGRYKVYSRETRHWSRKWEVWMPHSLFFHEGYALHATTAIRQLGRPASHGCVRLHPRDAKALFDEVGVGTPVLILPKNRDCSCLFPLSRQKQNPTTNVIVAAIRQK